MQMGMPLDDFIAMDGGTGLMQKADSLDELAVLLGFEGEAKQRLMDTIAHYNDIVESGVDTDYGKEPHRLSKIIEPPFYGCWFGVRCLLPWTACASTRTCRRSPLTAR